MRRNYRDIFEEGAYYHIYNKVGSNSLLFQEESDYIDFKRRLIKYFGHYFDILAHCLIPNHFHLLVKVKSPNIKFLKLENITAATKFINHDKSYNFFLENQFSRMLSGYAHKFNLKHKRCGPLFKEGIKRVRLKSIERIIYQLCYIHHNPIQYSIVDVFSDWRHSSYNDYKYVRSNKIVNCSLIFDTLEDMYHFDQIHIEFKRDFVYK